MTDPAPRAARPAARRRWPLLVGGLALLTHAAFFLLREDLPPSPDEREYLALGAALAEEGSLRLPDGDAARRPPLYPALLAAVRRWQGPEAWPHAVLAVQSVLSWAATLLLALLAERLGGPRAAALAGTVAALYSPFRFLQMSFLAETLLILLLTAAVYAYVAAAAPPLRTGPRLAALGGVSALLGLAALTRPNALLLLLPPLADTLARPGAARLRLARAAALTLPAVLGLLPWMLRNDRAVGRFTLSTTAGLNFYLGHNPDYAAEPGLGGRTDYAAYARLRAAGLSEAEADRELWRRGLAFLAENPGETARNAVRKAGVWFRPTVPQHGPVSLLLALATVAAAATAARREGGLDPRRRKAYRALLAALAATAAVTAYSVYETGLPLTTPLYVVPLGAVGLLRFRDPGRVRGLLIGLVLSQLAAAVVFIPLERIRWAVDGLFIVGLAVWAADLGAWFRGPAADGAAAGRGRDGASPEGGP